MAHQTWSARYHRKIGKTKAQLIREGIQQLQEKQQEQEALTAQAVDGGWEETDPHLWMLCQDEELKAEVFKKHNRACFTAIVWHNGDDAECGSIPLEIDAMRWCEDRIRAARLNARADKLRASGAADASEEPMNPEHLNQAGY